MPDEEMIERCAKAAAKAVEATYYHYEGQEPHMVVPDRTVDVCDIVIAVIKAMREPTEKMIVAAMIQPYPTVEEVGGMFEQAREATKLEWQAMIDEILK